MAVGETDEELEAASRGVRGLLSFYGSTPSYKPVLDVEGWGDLQPELNAMSKRGEWAEMSGLITDEMVDTIAVRGTPGRVRAQELVRPLRWPSPTGSASISPAMTMSDERLSRLVDEIQPRRGLICQAERRFRL